MKIVVVGPVLTRKSSGGVALFTESIADGLTRLGHDVCIVTDVSDRKNTRFNTKIVNIEKKYNLYSINSGRKMKKKIKKINPDLIISSLFYSFLLRNLKIKKIHFVHGFPSINHYGLIKFVLMSLYDRIMSVKFDYLLTNSLFSRVINQDLNGLKIDGVVKLGLGYNFFDELSTKKMKKDQSILYVGRLVAAKNIDKIVDGFLEYSKFEKKSNLIIVGYGPMENKIRNLIDGISTNINMIGKIDSEKISPYYRNSKIFISLNPHEPFGMVYLEALANNCFIICPKTGGQVEFLNSYPDRVKFVDPYSTKEIKLAIEEGLNTDLIPIDNEVLFSRYSYDNVARSLLEIVTNKKI